jgi:hypothetical protein
MASDPSAVEQAVSRTLRDNLGRIQRTSDELNQAISDLVSACASSRPTNALPPMVRAQTAAASLSAALEVLSRFVTSALQPSLRSPFEEEILRLMSVVPPAPRPPSEEHPEPRLPKPMGEYPWAVPPPAEVPSLPELSRFQLTPAIEIPHAEPVPVIVHEPTPHIEPENIVDEPALEVAPEPDPEPQREPETKPEPEREPEPDPEPQRDPEPEPEPAFNLASLPADEQELHRRAYRVAKVSMQDIKLLRPEDVRAGRENKDLCIRLRDDIEKAHKEYDRRFQAIQSHPVDYFYDWMVEILAGGNPDALGAYPYRSAVLRH